MKVIIANDTRIEKHHGICFATKQLPDVYNIGDDLCSPKHYYDFSIQRNDISVLVAGGGVFSDLGYRCAKLEPADIKIIWGFGLSNPLSKNHKTTSIFKKIKSFYRNYISKKLYSFSSSRDPLAVNLGYEFIPCPSCFHEMTEVPLGLKTGVVVNANPKTHGGNVDVSLEKLRNLFPDVIFETNAMSEKDAIHFFESVDKIVTNSYHFAYWSLLSGRKIQLISYSTKFTGLLEIFDLTPDLSKSYQKEDAISLESYISISLEKPDWIFASNHHDVLRKFRALNNDFANKINNASLGIKVNLKNKFVK
jgi:hypothetical protein